MKINYTIKLYHNPTQKIPQAWIPQLQTLINHLMEEHASSVNMQRVERLFDAHVFLAFHGDEIIGMAVLSNCPTLSRPYGIIDDFAVHPDHEGCGIGKHLMNELENYARETLHLEYLCLSSNPDNPRRARARTMYERRGYKETTPGFFVLKLNS